MTTLFISDLHLCAERPAITALLLEFLHTRAASAEALYILGDLFEAWLGDDAVQPGVEPIFEGLRAVTQGGVPVNVMHGNRDFLLGKGFERATGCRLIEDPTLIDLYGQRTLLMHGDTLCTDDIDYQQFRTMVRDPQWQDNFLARSPADRILVAKRFRELSVQETKGKAPEIMDVNAAAVEQVMREHKIRQLIHGHTHRPAVHPMSIDGKPARRIVLGDWYRAGSVLVCDERG
ncbi:MAG: UDP-2,3-diacylglucosamine hydrolase, partial [Gammaproteobacteria bacterium SG8_47]